MRASYPGVSAPFAVALATVTRAMAPPEAPARPRAHQRWRPALRFAALAAAALLGLYLIYPLLARQGLPLGPDGPLYVWWARFADAVGLDAVASRAGAPAATLALGGVLGTEPLETLAFLGPVLAAACGLAGGALMEAVVGPSRARTIAAVTFTGAWAAPLAGSYIPNLEVSALFLGALTAFGVSHRSWRGSWGGAGLLAAAGLAHRPFLAVLLAILAGAIAMHLPEALQERRAGRRWRDLFAVRLALGAGAGALGGGLGLLALTGSEIAPTDTSRDAFLRRAGLRDLLAGTFRDRILDDGRRSAVALVGGGALVKLGGPAEAGTRGARYLRRVLVWWAILSLGGLILIGIAGRAQANRVFAFAFFVPLAAAPAFLAAAARGGRARVWAGIAAIALLGGSMYGWYRRPPFMEPDELAAAGRAGRAVRTIAPGTPLVFLVDTDEESAAAFHVARFGNVIRAALPVARIPDVRLAVGRPSDYLDNRPTITGEREHDALSVTYLREQRPTRHEAIVLVLRPFNEPWFSEGVRIGRLLGPDIVAIGPRAGEFAALPPPGPYPRGLPPLALVPLSIATLLLLALLGGGWARWALPGASPRAVALLAPSTGVAAVILGAVGADRLGLALGGAGLLVVAGLAAAGYLAASRARI